MLRACAASRAGNPSRERPLQPTSSVCSVFSTSCRRRSTGLTARLFSSNAAAKLSIPTCTACASEKDRSIPDEGADPEQHDRDERVDLQGVVRQLRRDRAREVAGREHEPQLECGWYDKQGGECEFHHAE